MCERVARKKTTDGQRYALLLISTERQKREPNGRLTIKWPVRGEYDVWNTLNTSSALDTRRKCTKNCIRKLSSSFSRLVTRMHCKKLPHLAGI